MKLEFIDWLNGEVHGNGWGNNELARRADLAPATVSLVLSGQRNPGPEFCRGMARAFNLPPEEVFRRAGLLPSESAETRAKRAIRHLAEQMSDEELDLWNDIGRALLERRNRQTD